MRNLSDIYIHSNTIYRFELVTLNSRVKLLARKNILVVQGTEYYDMKKKRKKEKKLSL